MTLTQTRLLIRADVGPDVGTGHVMRMLSLGQAFRQRRGEVTFVVGDMPATLQKRLESERFRVVRIRQADGDEADAYDTCEIATLLRPDWIALDGYRFDDHYQSQLRRLDSRLLVMDDFLHAGHEHADLVINQNAYAEASDYQPRCERVLTGVKYALLREEFWSQPPARRRSAQARRVLVTFGGADPDNWTLRTLQLLADLNQRRLSVDCVVGNCYPHFAELEEFKRHAKLTLRIHRNVDRMSTLMQKADVAITAGGSTCYELSRCGVPAVVAAIVPHQEAVAEAMSRAGAMESIDHGMAPTGDRMARLGEAVERLIHSTQRRMWMSERGRRFVDGQGPSRVVDRMLAELVQLRAATTADTEFLWRWRNDPEVRAVSFQGEAISLKTHRAWLAKQLVEPNTVIWIARPPGGDPLGSVRFELQPEQRRAVISVVIGAGFRGRGWGTVLLRKAVRQLLDTTAVDSVLALIKPGNGASEKAFRAAGFQPIEPTVYQGKMALQYLFHRHPSQLDPVTQQTA